MTNTYRIGVFHYQLGHTDGVSLEVDKWRRVLEEMGNEVFYCAGDLGSAEGTLVEEMYHHIPAIEKLNHNTFKELRDFTPQTYKEELYKWVDILEEKFRQFILDKGINFIIPQNVWCVAANPAVAIALERVRREFNLPTLVHNHDFYWERTDGFCLTCPAAVELADKYLPPRNPAIKHAVINSLGQKEMMERKSIPSTVVPNVFDFEMEGWAQDEYNSDFREQIGLKENDIVFLQATRVVARKGIELAIDFVKAIDTPEHRKTLMEQGLYNGRAFTEDSRIVLVLAGYARDDVTGKYINLLKEKALRDGVDLVHIEDRVDHERRTENGKKIYSLWDTYVISDFVTYPSLWEGWGNQFLEALRAKLPVLIFEYPVYLADIKEKGFQCVSLGSQDIRQPGADLAVVPQKFIIAAAAEAVKLLTDSQSRSEVVDKNFGVGKKYYSMQALREILQKIMTN